jgi:hypothetical protein
VLYRQYVSWGGLRTPIYPIGGYKKTFGREGYQSTQSEDMKKIREAMNDTLENKLFLDVAGEGTVLSYVD